MECLFVHYFMTKTQQKVLDSMEIGKEYWTYELRVSESAIRRMVKLGYLRREEKHKLFAKKCIKFTKI